MANRKLSQSQCNVLSAMANGYTLIEMNFSWPRSYCLRPKDPDCESRKVSAATCIWLFENGLIARGDYDGDLRYRMKFVHESSQEIFQKESTNAN